MPVEHGVLIDIGGGSMQIARFRDRCLLQAWSLPLGALRLSDRFLLTDPPTPAEIRRLQEHVRTLQDQARIPPLASDEQVVGTGGTLRTLARIDRASQTYPIHRLHGYLIDRRALASMAARLASQTAATRTRTPGLGASRFDSIVGGAFCALATLDLHNRHAHTLDIVSAADLSGVSHRAIALLGALVRLTGKDSAGLKPFAPLVGQKDQAPLVRLAAILALADALVAQAPPASAARVMCQRTENGLALAAPWLVAWPLQSEVKRIQQIFAVPVQISTDHV